MPTVKEQVQAVLKELPDDCTIEDVQYRLCLIDKIRRRIEMDDQGDTVTQEEVEGRIAKWLTRK